MEGFSSSQTNIEIINKNELQITPTGGSSDSYVFINKENLTDDFYTISCEMLVPHESAFSTLFTRNKSITLFLHDGNTLVSSSVGIISNMAESNDVWEQFLAKSMIGEIVEIEFIGQRGLILL